MRVEIVEQDAAWKLEEEINEILEDYEGEVIDIKYSGCGAVGVYSSELYSAMIIFR